MRKELRMRSSRLFEQTYSQGKSVASKELVLCFLRREPEKGTKVGFSVSKKVGNAIVRNRTKRRLSSIIDHYSGALRPGYLLVLIARPTAAASSFDTLRTSVEKLLNTANVLGGR